MRNAPLVGALLLLASLLPAPASAYEDAARHYAITIEDGWVQANPAGVDVAWLGPIHSAFRANLNIITETDTMARNTTAWLLTRAYGGYSQTLDTIPGSVAVQGPRAHLTASGRIAADYLIDYNYTSGIFTYELRVLQIFLASEHWGSLFVLTATAHQDGFSFVNSTFRTMAGSFQVTGEPAPPGGDSNPTPSGGPPFLLYFAVGAIGGAAAGAAFWLSRRRRVVSSTPPPEIAPASGETPLEKESPPPT